MVIRFVRFSNKLMTDEYDIKILKSAKSLVALPIFFVLWGIRNFIYGGFVRPPLGSGWEEVCLSAGGSPRGSTTLRLLLREPLWGLFFNLAVERTHEPCVPTLWGYGIWRGSVLFGDSENV